MSGVNTLITKICRVDKGDLIPKPFNLYGSYHDVNYPNVVIDYMILNGKKDCRVLPCVATGSGWYEAK